MAVTTNVTDVNLYVMDGCPKCRIAKEKLLEFYKNRSDVDFRIIKINPKDPNDTDTQMLIERNMLMLPVLLVGDDFYNFSEIMDIVNKTNKGMQ